MKKQKYNLGDILVDEGNVKYEVIESSINMVCLEYTTKEKGVLWMRPEHAQKCFKIQKNSKRENNI